jgi:hypothetical protein
MSCSDGIISDEYVLKIEDVGLRKGVFERRFKLTKDYGANQEITPEILKNSINKILLPEYLFIQRALELGFDTDPLIRKNLFEFDMNILASAHPIRRKELFISDTELKEFHDKKTILFSYELVQHSSYNEIDSIYKSLIAGNKFNEGKKVMPSAYPRKIEYNNKTFGESVPLEVYQQLYGMEEGDISKPLYTPPIWVIVKLNKKVTNSKIEPNDSIKRNLIAQLQGIKKLEQIEKYTDSLKAKYKIEIRESIVNRLLDAFEIADNNVGYFSRDKFDGSITDEYVITTSEDDISVDMFFFLFNRSNMYSNIKQIVRKDIEVFIDDLSSQLALYLDAKDKKIIDSNETLKDQVENKFNKELYKKFLKKEISDKVVVSDEDARNFYEDNRETWKGEFEAVKNSIIYRIRNSKMLELKENLVKDLSNSYDLLYNDSVLEELSQKLTNEKKTQNSTD